MPSPIRFARKGAFYLLIVASSSVAFAQGRANFVPTGAEMEAPRGYVEMCARKSAWCAPAVPGAPAPSLDGVEKTGAIGHDSAESGGRFQSRRMRLNPQSKAELMLLKSVNRLVNGAVRQRTDQQIFHRDEFWQPSGIGPGAVGDCEDIALEKRIELIKAGFPAEHLALAVVYRHEIGLHTILVARTEAGDLLLDSRSTFIELWDKPPYVWVAIQSMTDEKVWRRVEAS